MSNKICGKVTVRVPATSANLGGGFDCMGLALPLYNTVCAEGSDRLIIASDVGAPADASNLIYRAMNAVFEKCGHKDASVKITTTSSIPQASGLGSSAACIVGGVCAANALLGEPLEKDELINLATALDGHPDNVLPAIVGGIAAGYIRDDGSVGHIRLDAPDGLTAAVATPDFALKTADARAALPETYSRADCVYSLSRAVVTLGAFATGNISALEAIGDRLHQPYRIPLIKGYSDVENAFKRAGAVAVCVSGAGPSVLALFDGAPKKISLPDGWTNRVLPIANDGVIISNS